MAYVLLVYEYGDQYSLYSLWITIHIHRMRYYRFRYAIKVQEWQQTINSGFKPPSGRYIFCLKNFDTFTRTSVRVSKMNAVARTQLTFQMLTLLIKYLYRQSQCSKTWDNKCLALTIQMFRAFGMNPKIGGSSPPQVEIFSVSKTLTLLPEHPFACRKWMMLPAHN